jgi:hypothetical protein
VNADKETGRQGDKETRRPGDDAVASLSWSPLLLVSLSPGLLVCLQEDVRRLEVAVDDAAAVGVGDGAGEGLDQAGGFPRRLGFAAQPLGQAASRDVLQGEVGQAVDLAELMDLHDARVLEAGHCLGLGAEARQLLGRRPAARAEHLERHDALEGDLPGPVDDAHPAVPQLAEDLVAGDARRGRGGHAFLLRRPARLQQRVNPRPLPQLPAQRLLQGRVVRAELLGRSVAAPGPQLLPLRDQVQQSILRPHGGSPRGLIWVAGRGTVSDGSGQKFSPHGCNPSARRSVAATQR